MASVNIDRIKFDVTSWSHIVKNSVAALLLAPLMALAQAQQVVHVVALSQSPKIDGNLAEWGGDGWVKVPVKPALDKAERTKFGMNSEDDKNQTGNMTVQVKVGVNGSKVYFALKYPDASADASYLLWEWRGDKYAQGKQRDDMLALRFHMVGDFDRSMLATKDYTADVWQWSAGRTNSVGVAEDQMHHMTTATLENAAEYSMLDGKTIYIKKQRDAGAPVFKALPRPKENKGEKMPSFEVGTPSGSSADVAAKGEWSAGNWHVEFGRALNTGNADDAVFKPGQKLLGQIAVFNKGFSEHKSVSEPLLFDFSAIK